MAELILRPTGDAATTSHTCSSGSAAYLLVNEEVADDDATYVYQTINSKDGGAKASWFKISAPSIENFKITSVEVWYRGKTTTTKSSDTSATIYYLLLNNERVQGGADELTSSYANHSKIYTNLNGSTFKNFKETGITGFGITTSGFKGASKNDDYEMRITQAWLKIIYEPVSETTATGIYIKQNGAYTQAQAAYKKVNGVWVQQTDIAALKTEMQTGRYKYGG